MMTELDDDLPVLRRTELRPFVVAARAQQPVLTNVTAESVHAGLEHRRRRNHTRRLLGFSAALAVAASLIAAFGVSWWSNDDDQSPTIVELDDRETEGMAEQGDPRAGLAGAVRLRSSTTPEIRGPWTIALGPGTHEIELGREASQALRIELPERTLELFEGSATIEVVEHDAVVRLHGGVAAWIAEDGSRSLIEVQRLELVEDQAEASTPEPEATPEPDPESAEALARAADRELVAGRREQAIEILRHLIELHPEASQTRAALLDLGRLQAAAGRELEARCAFELYLRSWPNSPVVAEVRATLGQLRRGRCRGLDPK